MVLTNGPMLAIIFAQLGHDFGFYIMVTDLPKYMKDVLHMSVADNGLFNALPYLAMWFVSVTTGILSDWLIHHEYITITFARKMFTTIGDFSSCSLWSSSSRIFNGFFCMISFSILFPVHLHPTRVLCRLRKDPRCGCLYLSHGVHGYLLPRDEG